MAWCYHGIVHAQERPSTDPIGRHIVLTPGVVGGRPRIAGTRIRVMDIVALHEMHRMTAPEICAAYPQLRLADVYAALAFYHDNRELFDEESHRATEVEEAFKKEFPDRVIDLSGA